MGGGALRALRNAKRAAKAQIASSEWALRGVRLSLAAEVATTYFTLLEYERDLSIARQTLRLRRESAALIDSMFRYGMSDGVALEQARSLVYTAEADIPQYCRAVEQTWLSMGILVGRNAAANGQRGGWAATADRLPPRGHSRGTALGAAQTPPRHPPGAFQHVAGGGAGRAGSERAIPVHLADCQRRSCIQFNQRFNCGEPLGMGCAGFRRRADFQFGKTSPPNRPRWNVTRSRR